MPGAYAICGAETVATRLLDEYDHVMYDRGIAGLDLGLFDPMLFRKSWVNRVNLVVHDSRGRNREWFIVHVEYLVGLGNSQPLATSVAGGKSAGSPWGQPFSTQRSMVSISSFVSDGLFLKSPCSG